MSYTFGQRAERQLGGRAAFPFYIGQALWAVSDNVLWLAVGLWVRKLTGNSVDTNITFLIFGIGTLCGSIVGAVADRFPRITVLMFANWITAVLVLGLFCVEVRNDIWIVYLVMLGYGLSGAVIGSSQIALLQTLLPAHSFGSASARLEVLQQGARLVVPLLGAGIFSLFGPEAVIGFCGACFVLSALSLIALLPYGRRDIRQIVGVSFEFSAGLRLILTKTPLLKTAILAAAAVFATAFVRGVSFSIVYDRLHLSAAFFTNLIVVQGASAVVGGLAISRLVRTPDGQTIVIVGLSLTEFGLLAHALAEPIFLIMGSVLTGLGGTLLNIGTTIVYIKHAPVEFMARAESTLGLFIYFSQCLGLAIAAICSRWNSVIEMICFIFVGIFFLAIGIYMVGQHTRRA